MSKSAPLDVETCTGLDEYLATLRDCPRCGFPNEKESGSCTECGRDLDED